MVALTEHRQDQGQFARMAQRVQSIGDAFGSLWLTIIGMLGAAGIVGVITFAWTSHDQITSLQGKLDTMKSTFDTKIDSMQGDLTDIKTDIRDIRDHQQVKPATPPAPSPP